MLSAAHQKGDLTCMLMNIPSIRPMPAGHTIRGDWDHLMLMERISPRSEVIGAIVLRIVHAVGPHRPEPC